LQKVDDERERNKQLKQTVLQLDGELN